MNDRELIDHLMAQLSPEEIQEAMLGLTPSQLDALAADAARESFAEFVRQAWHIIEPGELVWNWHLDAFCDHLQEVARGGIRRLVINVPPRHGKSNILTILWCAWVWTWRPSARFLFLSYSATLSTEHSVKCRMVIESEWYQRNFMEPGGWRLSLDQNQKNDFTNTAGGRRQSTSITGSLTGLGGDFIGIDDPLNADDAYSEAARNEANRVISQVVPTRLNDAKSGAIVLIMQRLHEEDPSGTQLQPPTEWEHLCLPAEFEIERRSITHHWVPGTNGHTGQLVKIEFWRDPREREGELLFAEKFPREVLEAFKLPTSLGPDGYAGQMQQRPMPAGGGMFKIENWRFWRWDDEPDVSHLRPRIGGVPVWKGPARVVYRHEIEEILISVDATFKKTKAGSFVAMHVWGKQGAHRMLLDRVHARMDFNETVAALLSLIDRWPEARRKLIEGKANGDAIIDTLRNVHAVTGIEAVDPGTDSKEKRAHAMQPYQAAGNVELHDGDPGVAEYISEHAMFPKGRYNDDVDAQAQGLQGFEAPKTTMDRWAAAL